MTAKEKARELVSDFYDIDPEDALQYGMEWKMSKECALICVDEILKLPFEKQSERNYWEEVKNEINKL